MKHDTARPMITKSDRNIFTIRNMALSKSIEFGLLVYCALCAISFEESDTVLYVHTESPDLPNLFP